MSEVLACRCLIPPYLRFSSGLSPFVSGGISVKAKLLFAARWYMVEATIRHHRVSGR